MFIFGEDQIIESPLKRQRRMKSPPLIRYRDHRQVSPSPRSTGSLRTPSRRTGRLGRQLTRRTITTAFVGNTVDSVGNPPGNDPHSILQTPEISHLPFEDPGPHTIHHGGPPHHHHRLHQKHPEQEQKIKRIISKINAEDIVENQVKKKEEPIEQEDDRKKDQVQENCKKENLQKRISNHVANEQLTYLMGPGSEAGAPPGRPECPAGRLVMG